MQYTGAPITSVPRMTRLHSYDTEHNEWVIEARWFVMPPEYRQYKVLDEMVFSSSEEEKRGIYKAVQLVKPCDGQVEIRVCYYTRRRRNDGSEWWGLSPRPLAFAPEEAQVVAEGINELAEKYMMIKAVIKGN